MGESIGNLTTHLREKAVADATKAVLHTSKGPIRLELYPNHAPKTVRNFAELAEGTQKDAKRQGKPLDGTPYYDGVVFHRIIDGFMIQTGDPEGTGRGGPGYTFGDEFHPELVFDKPYILAMANAGPGTNGSQFLITVGATPWLNYKHTIFGKVADAESEAVVMDIAKSATDHGDRPLEAITIERVEIER